MKLWITKYALSKGIFTVEAGAPEGNMLRNPHPGIYLYSESEWHRSEKAAVERANEMLQARIASLEKQLRKMRGLAFTVHGERA